MTTVAVPFPDELFGTVRQTPDEVADEMRLALAIRWYAQGLISQGAGASLAGLSRSAFLDALAAAGISPFQETLRGDPRLGGAWLIVGTPLADIGLSQPYDRALEHAMTPQKNVALEPDIFSRVAEEAKKQGRTPDDLTNEATKRFLALR